MYQTAQPIAADRYRQLDLDVRIATASPHALVAILYEGFQDALVTARQGMERQRPAQRLRAITRALAILDALDTGLDMLRGGTVARALAAVYAQVRALTMAGQAEARPELLAAAGAQIGELARAWAAIDAPSGRPHELRRAESIDVQASHLFNERRSAQAEHPR